MKFRVRSQSQVGAALPGVSAPCLVTPHVIGLERALIMLWTVTVSHIADSKGGGHSNYGLEDVRKKTLLDSRWSATERVSAIFLYRGLLTWKDGSSLFPVQLGLVSILGSILAMLLVSIDHALDTAYPFDGSTPTARLSASRVSQSSIRLLTI